METITAAWMTLDTKSLCSQEFHEPTLWVVPAIYSDVYIHGVRYHVVEGDRIYIWPGIGVKVLE